MDQPVRFTMHRGQRPQSTHGLPGSCRRVLELLRSGPASQPQLRNATGMAPRTLRYALHRLQDRGLVVRFPSLRDARRSYYSLRPSLLTAEERERMDADVRRLLIA